MTLFEYAMVLVSIVLALGVTQLLQGASEFVRSSRVYFGHAFWVLALLLIHVQLWWAMWDLHERASWTFLTFLYLLLGPVLLFFATNLLLPRTATESMDWASHFFAVRRWFFVSMAGIVVWGIFVTWLVGNVPLNHPYRVTQVGRLVLILVGFASANRQLHVWLPVGYTVYFVATTLMFRLTPTLTP